MGDPIARTDDLIRAATVSVIVPTRNRPELLRRALASIASQTRSVAEILVVDDASEPPVGLGSLPRIDIPVRLLRTEGIGPASARNHAASVARGDLLAFCDDDDEWMPSKIEEQLLALDDPAAVAVSCGYVLCDRDGATLLTHRPAPTDRLAVALLCEPEVQTSTLVVRRAAFEAVGGFPTDLARLEDWRLSIRLAGLGRLVTLPSTLVRRTPSSVSDEVMLEYRRLFWSLTASDRAALGALARRRIAAHHRFALGVHSARLGQRFTALAHLAHAQVLWPSPRCGVHLLRVLTGEGRWERLRTRVRRLPR